METTRQTTDWITKWLRWIARGIGTLWAAFFLFILVGELFTASDPITWEGVGVGVLSFTVSAGVMIAWWRERLGGWIAVLGALAFSVFIYFSAGRNQLWAMSVVAGPFLLSGLLFLAAHRRSKSRG